MNIIDDEETTCLVSVLGLVEKALQDPGNCRIPSVHFGVSRRFSLLLCGLLVVVWLRVSSLVKYGVTSINNPRRARVQLP
jgi:hypothetical protein